MELLGDKSRQMPKPTDHSLTDSLGEVEARIVNRGQQSKSMAQTIIGSSQNATKSGEPIPGGRILIDDPERFFQHLKENLKSRPPQSEKDLRAYKGPRESIDLADYCAVVENTHGTIFTFYMEKQKPWVQDIARMFVITPDGRDIHLLKAHDAIEGVSWSEFKEDYRVEKVPDSFDKSKPAIARDSLHSVKTFFGAGRNDLIRSFIRNYLKSLVPSLAVKPRRRIQIWMTR